MATIKDKGRKIPKPKGTPPKGHKPPVTVPPKR